MSKKQKIMAVIITLLFIGMILFKNRRTFFDPSFDQEIEIEWEAKREKAKLPLKKFNEEIFSNIEFIGVMSKTNYSRTSEDDMGGSHWIYVKINKPIIKKGDIPSKIPNIYDITGNPIKIYYHIKEGCVIADDMEGSRVEKKIGENFIRVYSNVDKACPTIYYTTDFDYFWK